MSPSSSSDEARLNPKRVGGSAESDPVVKSEIWTLKDKEIKI